jgi:hypothetical protein
MRRCAGCGGRGRVTGRRLGSQAAARGSAGPWAAPHRLVLRAPAGAPWLGAAGGCGRGGRHRVAPRAAGPRRARRAFRRQRHHDQQVQHPDVRADLPVRHVQPRGVPVLPAAGALARPRRPPTPRRPLLCRGSGQGEARRLRTPAAGGRRHADAPRVAPACQRESGALRCGQAGRGAAGSAGARSACLSAGATPGAPRRPAWPGGRWSAPSRRTGRPSRWSSCCWWRPSRPRRRTASATPRTGAPTTAPRTSCRPTARRALRALAGQGRMALSC